MVTLSGLSRAVEGTKLSVSLGPLRSPHALFGAHGVQVIIIAFMFQSLSIDT